MSLFLTASLICDHS